MPPEITAGLMALAGAPPGAAASAAPLPEPLGASLFAAFLAQSSPLGVTPAAPKAAATQILVADPKQTPPENQALLKKQAMPNSKTMDTLPTLSFSLMSKTTIKASELPLPRAAKHQKTTGSQLPAGDTPAPNTPSSALMIAGQAAAPPVLFAAPVLMTLAAAATAPITAATVPAAAPPASVASAAPLVQAAPEPAAPAPLGLSDTPVPIAPRTTTSGQTTSALPAPAQTSPAATVLPLPRTWAIAAPLQTVPQPAPAPVAVTPTDLVQAEPKAVSLLAVEPASVTKDLVTAALVTATAANGLPRVPSPVSAAPFRAVPQGAMLDFSPSIAQASQNFPIPSPAITAAAAAPLVAAVPTRQMSASPAKIAGKFLAAALKPTERNADTSTRTTLGHEATPGQDRTGSVKAGVPAAAPGPTPEKHAGEQPSGTAGGTNTVPAFSQAAALDGTAKADIKPLSASDRAEVVRQTAEGIGAMPLPAKSGASEQMSVQLHPKDWGSLQVSVTVAPGQNAGAVKTVIAHIVAETPQVKAALQSQTGALHQALRASGLHLEHLTVSVKAPESKAVEVKAIEVKAPEVKPAAQSASAGLSSRQNQADQSEQAHSFGQPGTNAGGFGMGSSQNNRQGQPPVLTSAPDPEEDDLVTATPLRPVSGRIDTRA